MEHQYEYFISEALDLPKDVWHPLRRAGQVRTYQKTSCCIIRGMLQIVFITLFPVESKVLSAL